MEALNRRFAEAEETDMDSQKKDQDKKKKPYQTPQLLAYGDVREITRAVGSMGAADGATHGMTKTAASGMMH